MFVKQLTYLMLSLAVISQIIQHQPASLRIPPTQAACPALLQHTTIILFHSPISGPSGLQTPGRGGLQTGGKLISQVRPRLRRREMSYSVFPWLLAPGTDKTPSWILISFHPLAMGGFGIDYLSATSSSESSWHQTSTPSGTWAGHGPSMEDSSAVLMESLKVSAQQERAPGALLCSLSPAEPGSSLRPSGSVDEQHMSSEILETWPAL